jgi:hypothetical protein
MATFYELYQNYLKNPYSGVNALPGVNPSSGIMNTIPQSEGRTEETITPIQTSIQQQLTPVGPLDGLIDQYLQMPSLLSAALIAGKDYMGLTDAQKDLYGSLGFGYSDQSMLMKDKFGYNTMASNFLGPNSTSRQTYKDKLGYTDEELDKIRDDLAGVPTKATMREQQRDYNTTQTQRQQDYFGLTDQGIMGIGLNPGAYGAHSLAALGPAYDDPNEFSNNVDSFGGPQSISADDRSMAAQAEQEDAATAAAAAAAVDRAGDGGDGYATGGRVFNGLDYLSGVERRGYAEGSVSQEGVIPGFEKIRDTVYFNSDGTPNLEKIKAANFLAGSSPSEFGYRDIKTGDVYGPSTYTDIASGRYPNIYDPSKYTATEQTTPTEDFSDYINFTTSRGGQYAIDPSSILDRDLESLNTQTTPTEDFSDYLNTTTINTNVQTTPTMGEPGGIITEGGLKYRINADGSKTLLESVTGPNGIEFKLVTGQFSGKPVYKAFYPEDYDFSKFGAIGGSTASEFDPEYFFKNIMAPEETNAQTTPTVAEQMVSPDDAMNQYDISNQMDEVTGVGSGALTAGSLFPKYIDDFQYAAPPGTDIDQVRNLARQTASDKSITALIKDVYNDPDKFKSDFKPKAKQIKTGYPQYLKEGILSATGFQPTSQIGGGTNAARAFLEKIKSVPGAQFLGKVLPGVGIASGVYDVGSRLSQGDYFGAGLGALSAIPFVGIPAAAMQATYDNRNNFGPLIEKATNFFNKLQSAPSNVTEHINTAVDSLNPYQQQRYVNYAVENPDRAITAAQQNKDFLAATQKNTNPTIPAPVLMADGGRVFYLQGGLASLLG